MSTTAGSMATMRWKKTSVASVMARQRSRLILFAVWVADVVLGRRQGGQVAIDAAHVRFFHLAVAVPRHLRALVHAAGLQARDERLFAPLGNVAGLGVGREVGDAID